MLGIIKEALTEAINEQPVAQSKEEVRWMKIAAFLRTNHIIQNVDVQNLLNVSPATASRDPEHFDKRRKARQSAKWPLLGI
ncbi:MAG: hypothetical protein ACLSTW_02280 [Faecalibacterium sp.]